MPKIQPVSDMRNHKAEITQYEDGLQDSHVYKLLIEAELQATQTKERRTHTEVMGSARRRLAYYAYNATETPAR